MTSKTPSHSFTFIAANQRPGDASEALRVSLSITWGKFPQHLIRTLKIKVGGFVAHEAAIGAWTPEHRESALVVLAKILEGADEAMAEFTRVLMEAE